MIFGFKRLLLYNFFTFGLAAVPFQYFYFVSRGMSFEQYSWLTSIYYATMVLCDVPTGILADRFGRKFVLILGPIGLALGFGLWIPANSFFVFALSQIVMGVGHAFISGAISSFLYDSLQERGKQLQFLQVESMATAFRLIGTSLAFFLGGALAKYYGLTWSIWATVALTSTAAIIACFFVEPKIEHEHPPSIPEIFRTSFDSIVQDRSIRWITIYFAVLFVWLRLSFQTYQAKLDEIGIHDEFAVGAIYGSLNIAAALCARGALSLQSRIGEGALFALMQACLVASFAVLGLSVSGWVFVLFFIQQIPFGLHFPVISSFVNHRIPSSRRNTILSFQSMAGRLAFTLFFPLFGWLESRGGLREAFLVSAGLGVIAMVWLQWRRPR